jgi:putative YphP/YqiW family bacilliredoxin
MLQAFNVKALETLKPGFKNGESMYPEIMVVPMREELTRLGIEELRSAADVDRFVQNESGTNMLVVNSICGCAAGRMRPAVRLALQNSVKPGKVGTVFAGQDMEATARAREHFAGVPPSSPSIAILRDGKVIYMMHRHQIETRDATAIAADLKAAFEQYCAAPATK